MKIGVFDSGLGGLSVLAHLKHELSEASFYYVADSGHAPYGDKSADFIVERCLIITRFLIEQHHVDAIVIACNTATAAAAALIREQTQIPVVAMEPALKPAALKTKSKKVGVLATASTLQSLTYQNLVSRYATEIDCYEQAAHGLVELIEAGRIEDLQTEQLLRQYIEPMLEQGVDSIVLGCTHYPFLMGSIKKIVGVNVSVIDTGRAVSEQLSRVLMVEQVEHNTDDQSDSYYSSGNIEHTKKMIYQLLNQNIEVEKLLL